MLSSSLTSKLREHPVLREKYFDQLWRKDKDGTLAERNPYRVLVVLRSDSTTLYATKDLALARRKFEDYGVDRSIYVIDVRQSLYFQQVFKALELWGFPQAEQASHLGYEMVGTKEGAFSSRKGNAPLYEDFEREALRRAREIVDRKQAELLERGTEDERRPLDDSRARGGGAGGGHRRAEVGDAGQGQQHVHRLRLGAGAQPATRRARPTSSMPTPAPLACWRKPPLRAFA